MSGATFKPRRACLRPLENFLRDPKLQKIAKIAFYALSGGSQIGDQIQKITCGDLKSEF